MVKKYEFIDRILFLIRKELEENLPEEAPLDEMYLEFQRTNIIKGK
jgi:hypothetical protein